MPNSSSEKEMIAVNDNNIAPLSRRKFLGFAGAATGLMVALAACDKTGNPIIDNAIDLGIGDLGILNYAYLLEQLEAAFYTKVIANKYSGITPAETALLTDVRDHEIAHREFFKNALGTNSIPELEFDFSSIDFTSRDSVLGAAKTFEDLGVSAYNGAGKLITNPDYLVLAGKIVSVEARHAAYIRDLISNGTFADATVINAMGLDTSRMPLEVLQAASKYIKVTINASHLPTF